MLLEVPFCYTGSKPDFEHICLKFTSPTNIRFANTI